MVLYKYLTYTKLNKKTRHVTGYLMFLLFPPGPNILPSLPGLVDASLFRLFSFFRASFILFR